MRRGARLFVGVSLLLMSIASVPKGSPAPVVNKVQVQKLELGYRLDSGNISGRVTLATSEAIDLDIQDKEEFLRVAQVFAGGRAHLNAEVQDGKVTALDITIQ